MHIKPFKKKHLPLLAVFNLDPKSLPKAGWVAFEDGKVLALGFLRLIEGDMAAIEVFDRFGNPMAWERLHGYITRVAIAAGLTPVKIKR